MLGLGVEHCGVFGRDFSGEGRGEFGDLFFLVDSVALDDDVGCGESVVGGYGGECCDCGEWCSECYLIAVDSDDVAGRAEFFTGADERDAFVVEYLSAFDEERSFGILDAVGVDEVVVDGDAADSEASVVDDEGFVGEEVFVGICGAVDFDA